jgi:hypothetical protein
MLSLYLKILEGETRTSMGMQRTFFPSETFLPDLSTNIQCGNSLVDSDFFDDSLLGQMDAGDRGINAFDWKEAFPDVMRKGGFDAVVGNPPYIRIQLLKQSDPDQLRYFAGHYRTARQGSYDIYVVFVEKGLKLLNKRGLLGYILPNKFLTTDYGASLRELLAEGRSLMELIDFGHAQVFEDATTFTCLLFLSSAGQEQAGFALLPEPTFLATDRPQLTSFPNAVLSAVPWTFGSQETAALRAKIELNATPLLDLPTLISRGSSTGADPIFMLLRDGNRYRTRDGEEVDVEESILRTPIYATDFTRYNFRPLGNERVIFPYIVDDTSSKLIPLKTLSTQYPKTYAYLLTKKRQLTKRKGYATWFSFSAPRNLVAHESAEILVPLLADRGLACKMQGKGPSYCMMASGGFSISVLPASTLDPNYVLGLLNSELLFWYLRGISNKFRGGWITCTKQYIGRLPIRHIDRTSVPERRLYENIIQTVKMITSKHTDLKTIKAESERQHGLRRVKQLEKKLNGLVYHLYDITDIERANIVPPPPRDHDLATSDETSHAQSMIDLT